MKLTGTRPSKWHEPILAELRRQPRALGYLRRTLDIDHALLTQTLRVLQSWGLIERFEVANPEAYRTGHYGPCPTHAYRIAGPVG